MEFAIPTTREEMFSTLTEIYSYYRFNRGAYSGLVLDELELENLVMDIPDDAELREQAKTNTFYLQAKEKRDYTDELKRQIAELGEKLSEIELEYLATVETVEKEYSAAISEINASAVCSDTEGSGIVFAEISGLEGQKAKRLEQLFSEKEERKSSVNAEIAALTEKLGSADEYFGEAHDAQTEAEYIKLKKENELLKAEVLKYNNTVSEKIQKYRNTIKQTQASLELRFLAIKTNVLTKEELVELGYYNDVIDCVCGYYNTLSATSAYNDIKNEGRLAIYLEDYYQNIVYLYKTRASS